MPGSVRTAIATVFVHVLLCLVASLSIVATATATFAADIQWHPVTKSVAVEDMTEFSVWLLGYRDGAQATPGQIVRLNASVPALTAALTSKKLQMIGTAPMNAAIQVTGLRVLYATRVMPNGRADTNPLATPVKIEAGKAVLVVYDLETGKVTLNPQ